MVEAARLQRGVVRSEGLDAHEVVEHEAHGGEVRAVVELGDVRGRCGLLGEVRGRCGLLGDVRGRCGLLGDVRGRCGLR